MSQNVRPLRRPSHGTGRRLRANWSAKIKARDGRIECRVIDISADGASVQSTVRLSPGTELWLVLDHAAPVKCSIVWDAKDRFGLRFRSQQHWVHAAFAERFDPSAWLSKEQ